MSKLQYIITKAVISICIEGYAPKQGHCFYLPYSIANIEETNSMSTQGKTV